MEAVASVTPWNPEDDLLLKNAVEAGASLEALAKGAVRFSRKFTVGELRDRWHSLLYDADVSAEASARMVEFELSKSAGVGISKETVGVSAKRKVCSIRRQYYARRKRMCAFNSFNLSFLDPSNVNNAGGGDCEGELAVDSEVLDGNCMVGDHVGSYFEFPERGIGIVDHVPLHTTKDVVVSADTVGNTKNDFPLQENHPEIPSLLDKDSVEDNSEHNFKRNFAEKGLHSLEDNLVDYGNCADGEDVGPSHVLSDMPLWKTIEDISAPEMPINDGLEEKGHNGEEELANPEDVDGNEMSASGYDVDHSQSIYEDKQVHDEVDRSTAISGGDFPDISDSLLNLTNEDEHLFMDVDAKDTMDKSCYDNINPFLKSSKDDVPDACQPQTLDTNTCDVVPGDVSTAEMGTTSDLFSSGDGDVVSGDVVSGDMCTAEMGTTSNPFHSGDGDQQIMCSSEVNISSSKSVENPHISSSQTEENPHSPELLEMMDCKLNSEDPEIPCNDDIHPFMFDYPIVQSRYIKAIDPASSSLNQMYNKQEIRSLKKEESLAYSFPTFQNTVPKTNANHPLVSCAVKRELPDGNCLIPVPKHDNNISADPSPSRSGYGAPNSAANQVLKEEEINAALIPTEPSSTYAAFMETEANPSALDEEESVEGFDGDDNDIPNFSDIETMILEMDLSPDEEDSYVSKEVLRYQHEDAKRKIIRLEQCARSSMQRAIAYRNAFAVLYGRHLKQYIKKTEVILGRATEENEVDIDLAKEGRANKISRRQALIKMEGDGSFFLKNIGKSSIFLNGKEVASGQLLSLCSNSLIEIRGMSFVFEMNHKSVRRCVENTTKNSQEKYTKFEWSTEGNP